MFERKCTLCGGKLNQSRICTECGLNNNKSERYYKPNTSGCDHRPLTHVHTQEEKDKYEPEPRKATWSQPARKLDKKKWFTILTVVFTICGLGVGVASSLDSSDTYDKNMDASMDVAYDPYDNVERKLSEEGEPGEYTLAAGNYIVGVHIPEGRYQASTQGQFDSIEIQDRENGIYMYEYEGGEDNHLDDLRLYEGALVKIGSENAVILRTEHAQDMKNTTMLPNPLTESVACSSGSNIAGKDFPAGIYDLNVTAKSGYVDISIDQGDGNIIRYNLYRNSEGKGEGTFNYMVLPEGAIVECQKGSQIELVPTPNIISTDYEGFYR